MKLIGNWKLKIDNWTAGMTYVELIVVLGIFSTMLSIAMFNHSKFQDKVSIKALANEIALRLVEAQKSAISGKLQTVAFTTKPSYGVHFNLSSSNQDFIYFADLNNNNQFSDPSFCPSPQTGGDECLEKISLTRGNTVSDLDLFYTSGPSTAHTSLTLTFTRPASDATIQSSPSPSGTIDYAQITVTSSSGLSANIKLYPSGRVQIN